MQGSPFSMWSSLWGSAFALAESGLVFSEMMRASAEVVNVRSRTIWDATRNPVGADYKELGRMVSEKVEAFSEAGAAALADVRRMQGEALGQWQQMMALASGARTFDAREASSFLARQTRMLDCAASATGKAMAPLHRRAAANAKRLGKKR